MLTILAYHNVVEGHVAKRTKKYVDHHMLELQLRTLKALGNVVSLNEGLARGRGLVITFDDGYRNFLIAARFLERFSLSATLFVPTAKIGQHVYEEDYSGYVEYLSEHELVELSRGSNITLGSHAHTHRRLGELPIDEVQNEIVCSASILKTITHRATEHFCYPYGCYSGPIVALLKGQGFFSACTTMTGTNQTPFDRYALKRIAIDSHMSSADLSAIVGRGR